MENKKVDKSKNLIGQSPLKREDKYKIFIELSSEGIWRFEFENQEGIEIQMPERKQTEFFFEKAILVECNDAMAKMYGYESHKDITGIRMKDVVLKTEENIEMFCSLIRANYQMINLESKEKDNKGNIKYFMNNVVGIIKEGKMYGFWGTQRDITDRKKAEDVVINMNLELAKKNEQLVHKNSEMDNFIFAASHDLNAPLSNIEGLINVLKLNDLYKQEEPKLILDMMEVAIHRFKKTIKDLTEVTRAEVELTSEKEETSIKEVYEEVEFSIKNFIADTNCHVIHDFSQCEFFLIKKINLHSILYNLLSNAIKYRHPDREPEVIIKTYKENSFSVLEVKDNGIGIPSDQVPRMFTMFRRLHSHVEGTGVGLYIIKRIVENAGGKVELESELDKGSKFRIFLKRVDG